MFFTIGIQKEAVRRLYLLKLLFNIKYQEILSKQMFALILQILVLLKLTKTTIKLLISYSFMPLILKSTCIN